MCSIKSLFAGHSSVNYSTDWITRLFSLVNTSSVLYSFFYLLADKV